MASTLIMGIDKIQDQTGYFVLNHEGAVLLSSGDLENNDRMADQVIGLVKTALKLNLSTTSQGEEKFKRISLNYKNFSLLITLNNQRVYVVKRPNKFES